MRIQYDCKNIMLWEERGEEFADCKIGKMTDLGNCPKKCNDYVARTCPECGKHEYICHAKGECYKSMPEESIFDEVTI